MAKKDTSFITTGEHVRNYVGIAFVISIILHLIVSPFFPNLTQHHADDEVEKVSVTKKVQVKVPTPPPPSPTPPPTPTPPPQRTPPPHVQKQVVQPKLKVNIPHTTNNSQTSSTEAQYNVTKGNESGVPAGTSDKGTPVPGTPAPTAKPACANPNQEATVTNPMQPEYPQSAQDMGLGPVTVLVQVTVGPTGSLVNAAINKSSGNMAIDQAALRAARQSQYAPKLVNCSPTTGDYIFRADFQPD